MVYKKSYFDEETQTAYFDLNEENIRHFFAYRSTLAEDDPETCFGEFIVEDENGFYFRTYDIFVSFGDYGVNDTVVLVRYEWKISRDGKIERAETFGEMRELELPSHRLTDTLYN